MAAPAVLVIASGNAGKVREFGALLADLGLQSTADYIAYKAGVGFAAHVKSNPRL